jgi:predicted aldo/keto reductase-like oxidoreductase
LTRSAIGVLREPMTGGDRAQAPAPFFRLGGVSETGQDGGMNRRDFLTGTAAATAMTTFPATLAGIGRDTRGPLERRTLGRTGESLSIIGFGGIVVMNATPAEAADRVAMAVDRGVNYFDVAPSYGDAESKLGPALEPHRSKVFLACKTQERRRAGALAELERSLGLMRTDHFDLYQHHAVTSLDDVRTIFGPDGAMEAFLEARKAGKVRHLGFSAHSVEAALALMEGFAFDTVLFPFNYRSWHAGDFGPKVAAEAHRRGMGLLALKAMARGPWAEGAVRTHPKCWYEPLSDPEDALLGLRFTLSHPITAAIPPGDESLFSLALDLAPRISPLAPDELERVRRLGASGAPLFRRSAAA